MDIDILNSAIYDLSRLGIHKVERPEDAAVLFVGGWVSERFSKKILDVYERIQQPKYVIGVGTCSISGTPYISNEKKILLEELLPVHVFVSGCPPTAEAYIESFLELRRLVAPKKTHREILQTAIKSGSVQV